MNTVWLLLSAALSLALGAFLVSPLFETAGEGAAGSTTGRDVPSRLHDAKERALRSLKDLELDYRMGKMSPDDFERSKRELSQEVAQILEELRRYE